MRISRKKLRTFFAIFVSRPISRVFCFPKSRIKENGTAHSRPQSLRSFLPAAGIESSGSNHFRHAS